MSGCGCKKSSCASSPVLGDMIPLLAQASPSGASSKPLSVTFETLAPGLDGTLVQTLPTMESLVRAAVVDPRVRRAAEWIVKKTSPGDRIAEARAIFDWILERLQFRRDPIDMQLLQDPVTLLTRIQKYGWAAGNCAAHAMLAASLGITLRLPIVWVLAGDTVDEPQHVYAAMRTDTLDSNAPVESTADLVSLDTAVPDPAFGKHAPAGARSAVPALRGL